MTTAASRIRSKARAAFAGICLTSATLMALTFTPWATADEEKPTLAPTSTDENVAQKIVSLVGRHHYSHPELNDAVSRELFDEYFDRLDPDHTYFLQTDIDEFAPFRDLLDDQLTRKGQMDFAYAVFSRMLQRMSERHEYARQRLEKPFDFAADDTMLIDRSEAPFAADMDESNAIWDARLKNQMLLLIIAKEEAEARKAAAAAGEEVEDEVEDPRVAIGLGDKTPEERIIQRYTNYERWMTEKDGLDVMEIFLSTFTSLLDPHSTYWNWRTYEDFTIEMRLSFDGIGATLNSIDGYTRVVSIIAGGPASQDGRLQPGDIITAVGQGPDGEAEDVINLPLDKVVRKIRGKKDSVVRLWVQKSLDDVPTVIDIVRGEVKLSEKEAKGEVRDVTLPGGESYKLGVIKLPGFYADAGALRRGDPDAKSATGDVKRLLDKMIEEDNIDGLVFDLRGNGGGYLFEAISLTGLFIPEGPVVQIRYPGSIEVREDEDDTYYDLPLVVMVDRATASASEIFAAAIQDYDRGVVVGDKSTHGKGTVQDVMDLKKMVYSLRRAKPGALKFTVAKYYRVNGGSTQQKGVEPDITLPNFRDQMEIGEAYLPHVMVWDEIPAQDVDRTHHAVSRLIDSLRVNSQKRRDEDHIFDELMKVINYFQARREMKNITLNKEDRLALRAEDELWSDRRDALLALDDEAEEPTVADTDVVEAPEGEEGTNQKYRDIYLDEGLNILADLIQLTTHGAIAHEGEVPTEETRN